MGTYKQHAEDEGNRQSNSCESAHGRNLDDGKQSRQWICCGVGYENDTHTR